MANAISTIIAISNKYITIFAKKYPMKSEMNIRITNDNADEKYRLFSRTTRNTTNAKIIDLCTLSYYNDFGGRVYLRGYTAIPRHLEFTLRNHLSQYRISLYFLPNKNGG